MRQRIIIKVELSGKNSRPKIFEVAGKFPGVELINIIGQEKNHVEVIGDGIDSTELTKLLRKKVGSSDLVSVGPSNHGGDGYGYGYSNNNGSLVNAHGGAYYSNPNGYGSDPSHGHNSYGQVTSRHGYLTNTHNPHTYGPYYVYETSQHDNPSTCSIM